MAEIMVAVMPFAGHVAPVLAVVSEFVARGHTVRVYTGAAYADRFAQAGAHGVLWNDAPDFDEHDLAATFPQLRGRKGPRQTLANLEHLFIRTGAAQHRDLMRAWEERPWQLLVADSLSCGTALVAESTPAPWATFSLVPLTTPSPDLPPAGLGIRPGVGHLGRARDAALRGAFSLLGRGLHRAWNETRASAGLVSTTTRFDSAWVSPTLTCVAGLASLDFPRSDLPDTTHYVGTVRTTIPTLPRRPPWWPDVESATTPIVHVTQGTLNVDPNDLLRPAMIGLADAPVLVVAATGPAAQPMAGFKIPSNARVAGFLNYDELLPRTSVMITNGGWGGVLAALSHGIPLIVAGGDIDKPEIAARIAYNGVGIDLRTGTPTPEAIAAAYRKLTSSPSFHAAAGRVADELAASGGAGEIVARCEVLIR
ncbi:glycosyltransferase [Mycetocola zhadangensis]|uniref:Glycosyltransferase n=1 Tax=Mycetocola zhadangensis TaxID=1164595 RepID=A0A3L7J632_9MICO|nr:glycosyltransferase [Mycetocola zhadangensis]RLQ86117.1 glycosyltransferase [Mycetocola zhadangensis]GGE88517.1 glycosyl transferase [Mycetocola zhadangensis]